MARSVRSGIMGGYTEYLTFNFMGLLERVAYETD